MESSEEKPSARANLWRWALLAVLAVLAGISLWQGVSNALVEGRSQDFQWSGTRMLIEHTDPWQDYMTGDPAHGIFKLQFPNYLALLYVLLAPLGLLPLATATAIWAGCNVLFGVLSAILCGRFFGLRWFGCSVLLALMLMSTPMRTTLGNGQQGLLVLMLWVLALCRKPGQTSGAIVGLSYFKYTFAPPVFFFLWMRVGWRAALESLLPALATLLLAYVWLHGSLLHPAGLLKMAIEPLQAAHTGYFGGAGPNLMDALDWGLGLAHAGPVVLNAVVYGVPLALSALLLYRVTRGRGRLAWEWQISLLAVISMALFKHHAYDGVVLLFPVAYCLKHIRQLRARWSLGLLCYLWLGDRLLRAAALRPTWSFLMELGVLLSAGILIAQMRIEGDHTSVEWSAAASRLTAS